MKIIKYEKQRGNKYKVYLDNDETITLYEDVILNNNLLLSKEINDLTSIKEDNLEYEAYDKAIKYISYKMRSKKEIKTYLRKIYEDEIINKVIDKLLKNGLINDSNYVLAYYQDKINLSNDGPNKIKDNLNENIEELNDIYLEYELLLREDIVDRLYVQQSEITIVDNYNDLRPQLIHILRRDPNKFRSSLEEKVKDSIIKERDNKDSSEELTKEEELEFNKRINLIEAELDPTQVNYSFEPMGHYTDSSGFRAYKSDTSNQIAASIYSEKYFLKSLSTGLIGIGFNKEGLTPEAIALSSSSYLTTNMGLNNIEYDENKEFDRMSAPYEELKENDGNSEIVMFRRNMEYDTKASYIFCTIDSSNEKRSKEMIEKCKELSKSSKLKIVVYDLYKIRKSYEESLKEESIQISKVR